MRGRCLDGAMRVVAGRTIKLILGGSETSAEKERRSLGSREFGVAGLDRTIGRVTFGTGFQAQG